MDNKNPKVHNGGRAFPVGFWGPSSTSITAYMHASDEVTVSDPSTYTNCPHEVSIYLTDEEQNLIGSKSMILSDGSAGVIDGTFNYTIIFRLSPISSFDGEMYYNFVLEIEGDFSAVPDGYETNQFMLDNYVIEYEVIDGAGNESLHFD